MSLFVGTFRICYYDNFYGDILSLMWQINYSKIQQICCTYKVTQKK